ncbi:MAG TPA: glycoside hydrolase family 30 beta sandwich domain-containing protein [Gemmatimonadaceae bacterium]|jgi:O-glycosyl hydrolase|nr:glycoside hydrolase family 30 beta sandwich domain-containing protein [Gemmatimonadaceae bacterium]
MTPVRIAPRRARPYHAFGATLALALTACAGDGIGPGSCAVAESAAPLGAPATISLDPSRRFQTIDGFGTSLPLFDDPHVTETFDQTTKRAAAIPTARDQAKILDLLYRDLGLTRARVSPDGIEAANDNADPNVADLSKFDFGWKRGDGYIAAIEQLRSRGVTTWFASPITIESWMSESNPAEYAEWVLVMLRHWRDAGVEMPYYSLVNEPGYVRSGYWSGAWMRDVAKILGPRMAAEGLKTKLVVPDDFSASEAYGRLQTILADPDARKYVGAVAYHLYERGREGDVRALAAQYGIPVWMTEYSTPGDWLAWAAIMQELLVDDGVSAVDYLWGYFGDWDGSQLVRIRVSGSAYAGYDVNRQYYVMGQYSRYVRPGAVRIASASAEHDVKVAAFVDGATLVVVATNLGASDHTVDAALAGGASCPTGFDAVRTSETESWAALPTIAVDGPRFSVTLPAKSVTTFVSR